MHPCACSFRRLAPAHGHSWRPSVVPAWASGGASARTHPRRRVRSRVQFQCPSGQRPGRMAAGVAAGLCRLCTRRRAQMARRATGARKVQEHPNFGRAEGGAVAFPLQYRETAAEFAVAKGRIAIPELDVQEKFGNWDFSAAAAPQTTRMLLLMITCACACAAGAVHGAVRLRSVGLRLSPWPPGLTPAPWAISTYTLCVGNSKGDCLKLIIPGLPGLSLPLYLKWRRHLDSDGGRALLIRGFAIEIELASLSSMH